MADRFDLVNFSKSVTTTLGGATANVNFDANTLFIDGTNNRVGIGTGTPDATRALTLDSSVNYGGIDFRVSGSTQARIQQEATGNLYIDSGITANTGSTILRTANGSERMRIDSSGNMGIGTSSPQAKLVASNAGAAGLELFVNYPGGGVGTYIQSYNRSTSAYINTAYDAAAHSFRTSGTERANIDSSGNFQFNSGYGSVATAYGCRAWVNFNGTGTVAIRSSGNVSSITDNGVGDYSVNYTNAMPDANYAYSHAYSNEVNVVHGIGFLSSMTTGAIRVQHYNISNSGNTVDKGFVQIVVFR